MADETTEETPAVEQPVVTCRPATPPVLETDRQICTARFSPCGKMLITGGYDASLHRWNIEEAEPNQQESLAGHNGWVVSLVFDGKASLFSADSWGRICAWSYAEPMPKPNWQVDQAHDGWIRSLAVSNNSDSNVSNSNVTDDDDPGLIVSGGRDGFVRVRNADDGELVTEFDVGEDVFCVAIHPDGQSILAGDLMGELTQWDIEKSECVRRVNLDAMHYYERIQDAGGLRILRFEDDGRTLVCAGAEPTKVGRTFGVPAIYWLDWESLEIKRKLQLGPEKDGYVYDMLWHSDGFWAMVTSGPPGAGKLQLLAAGSDEPFHVDSKMYNPHGIALHPNGRRLVVVATNQRSQGNGAVLDKEGEYLGNSSPLYFFDLVQDAKSEEPPA